MILNTDIQILNKIKKAKRGTLFFISDFIVFGNQDTIRQALQRLVKSGEIDRITAGIFVRPQKDAIIGKVMPDIEEIAKAIARRDRARIIPTGNYALKGLKALYFFNPMATPRVQMATPRVQMATPRVQMTTPRVQMATPRVQTATTRVQTATPRTSGRESRWRLYNLGSPGISIQ